MNADEPDEGVADVIIESEHRSAALRKPVHDWGPPPRLGLAHLMLAIAFSSAQLALVRSAFDKSAGWLGVSLLLTQSVIAGASWTGLAVLGVRLYRSVSWPLEPGHWLLAAVGARMAVETVLVAANASWEHEYIRAADMGFAAFLFACVAPTLARSTPKLWRATLLIVCAALCAPLLTANGPWSGATSFMTEPLTNWTPLIVFLAPLLTVAREVRQGMRRTWIHWAGAVIWSMYLLLENALAIWEWVRWILGAK